MKIFGLKKIASLCLPLTRGELMRGVVLLVSTILIILASIAMTGCGVTALGTASYQGHTDVVKNILNKGADINENCACTFSWSNNVTALTCAAHGGHMETVKVLLERGADVNASTSGDWTPLVSAAYAGHTGIAKFLIEKGADVDVAMTMLDDWTLGKNGFKLLARLVKKQQNSSQSETIAAKSSQETHPTIKSDVDELPAIKAKPNQNAYAIVIGIEKYRQNLPKADYADNDAKIMAEYLEKVMGYPGENIVTLLNDYATKSDLEKYLGRWLPNNVEKGSSVFIYYSGHGAPNPKTGDAYLVPYDGDPSFIEETGYPLKRLYAKLDRLQAKEIIVVLDSCFSGAGGRSVLAKGARPLIMNLDKQMLHSDRIAILSAAAGNQISSTYEEKGHGLFTYFFLKGIKNGNSELGGIYNYLKPQVERIARKTYNNEQTPGLMAPAALFNLKLYDR